MINCCHSLDIYNILRLLGFQSKHFGTSLIIKIVKILLTTNDELFNLEEIYRVIIESYPNKNLTTIDVRSYIRYAINHRDINKSIDNFESIFGYDYDEYIFCNKEFITELFRILRKDNIDS